jgi:hypothetical protein
MTLLVLSRFAIVEKSGLALRGFNGMDGSHFEGRSDFLPFVPL